MSTHATARSKILGIYIQFKGIEWALMGLVLYLSAVAAPGFWEGSNLRLFAYYLLVFAAPGALIWVAGVLMRYRHRLGWYLGVGYLLATVLGKVLGGVAEIPVEAWYWVSQRVPTEYLMGIKIFGFLAAVVFATDLAALLALLSPRGRDCWGIGERNPEARI